MGAPSDFVADFMSLTDGLVTPPLFRLWSAISAVSGALERRVWIRNGPGHLYPNLYILLVAPPGVGKFIIESVRALWQDTLEPGSKLPAFHVASDSITNASMMDELNKAKDVMITPSGPPFTFHSLLIAAEEFQVLLPTYDQQFIASLNSIWNNKDSHRETRRTGSVKELNIENPHMCILGGAQPAYFASTFPEEAWNTGLIRRIIMIFSNEVPLRPFFYDPGDKTLLRQTLVKRLAKFSTLYGEVVFSDDAKECLEKWHMAGRPPKPTHSKLKNYELSRSIFVAKLATISAISRTDRLRIEHTDVERAMEWLINAESLMPDIFREMIGKSDNQIMEELHMYLTKMWVQKGRSVGLTSEVVYEFLAERATADKVKVLFEVAEKTGLICRIGGTQDLYRPKGVRDFREE